MRYHLAAAIVAATLPMLAAAPTPARAYDYPWCAHYTMRGGSTNCGFSTLEQCKATVSGIGGYCAVNLRWQPSAEKPSRGKRRHSG